MNRVMLMSGGTGFLMSYLAKQFLKEGHRIIFLVRPSETSPEERMRRQLGDLKCDQWRVIAGDITKPLWGIGKNDLNALKGNVTEVWHGAALVSFDSLKKEFARVTNIEGTRNALEVAEYLGALLHYISTAYIARENANYVAEEAPVCRVHLRNIYEKTKCDAEFLIHQWQKERKGSAVIYRPAILIGDSRTGEAQSFTGYYGPAKFLWKNKKMPFFFIPYVKSATLNLMPIDWAVALISEISKNPQSIGMIFHIVHPNPPLVSFLFSHGFHYFHIRRFLFIPLPKLFLESIQLFLNGLTSILPFREAKHIKHGFIAYMPYFAGEPHFSQKNVEAVLGMKIALPPIDKKILDRCLDYAINHNFGIS